MRTHSGSHLTALVLCLALLADASASCAAIITWGAVQGISGDSDVSTNGTLIGALNFGPVLGAPSTTVNGVLFTGLEMNGGPVSSGNFALSGAGAVGATSPNPPFSNLSPQYRTLLSTFTGGLGAPLTLTISGLLSGQTMSSNGGATLPQALILRSRPRPRVMRLHSYQARVG